MTKTENYEKLPLQPPETKYMSTQEVLKLPLSQTQAASPWELRVQAAKLLEQTIGDEVQMTALKVKGPALRERLIARLSGREPNARLYAEIKF